MYDVAEYCHIVILMTDDKQYVSIFNQQTSGTVLLTTIDYVHMYTNLSVLNQDNAESQMLLLPV